MGIVLDVLPGAIPPEAGLEKVEYAAFLYLKRLFLVGILGNLFALPVLGRAEPLEHPASGHGLEDGVQTGRIYPPPSVTQVRHQLREILENLTHTLLPGPLLPWEVEGVIIHLAQVLSLLVGIVAANQATKEAAAMANGFTGIMGYASTIVSGMGIAFIKEHFGWGVTLGSIAGFAIIGMILFLFAWNAAADGYKRK